MTSETSTTRIDQNRLWGTIQELGAIGAYPDEETGLDGVRRLALTDEDLAGRQLVEGWMKDASLTVRTDQLGNVYARRSGLDDGLAPVMIASHIDSVATAGKFDGCLGVLGGLEVVRTLNDNGISTQRPIEVAIFTEEEGSRFGTDMLGSAVAAGRVHVDDALQLADRDGVTVGEELVRHGLVGELSVPIQPPFAYLECHIEQGPILADAGKRIGVVEGVQAISWQELVIVGRAAHAGTTPHHLRKNAGLAAALVTVRLNQMVESGDYGKMLATVGRQDIHPNLINIVPSKVLLSVDLRNSEDEAMSRAETDLAAYLNEVEELTGTTISARTTAKTPLILFPRKMQDLIAATATNLGLDHAPVLSGAGHDAGEIVALCQAGMVFVPGLYDGISHNPREFSTPEACADGINVLLHAALELAGRSDS